MGVALGHEERKAKGGGLGPDQCYEKKDRKYGQGGVETTKNKETLRAGPWSAPGRREKILWLGYHGGEGVGSHYLFC